MKTQTIIRSSVAVLSLVIASACGDSSGPTYQDGMSESDADNVGETTYIFALQAFRGMNFGSPQVGLGAPPALTRFVAAHQRGPEAAPPLRFDLTSPATIRAGLQAVAGAGCSVTATGTDGDVFDPIDANENGIPDDWSVKATCVSYDSLGDSLTRVETEHYSIRMKEHTDDLYGFDASASSDDHEDYTNGNDERQGYGQVHNVSVTASGATSKYSYHYWFDYLDEGVRENGEWNVEVNLAFDPDGTITLGAPSLPDGDLTINGSARILDSEEGNVRFELSTPDPWSYSAECAASVEEQQFVDGTLLGLLNGNEDVGFSLSWSPCGGSFDFDVFGEDVVEVAPRPWNIRSR